MILQFPSPREPTLEQQRRTCFRCIHAAFIPETTVCTKYDEPVESERFAAVDCEGYEEEE